MASNRPSYLPPDASVPPGLLEEEAFWTTGENLVLSTESTRAILNAQRFMNNLYASNVLQELGLNTKLEGSKSLKGHCTRVAVLGLLINDVLHEQESKRVADPRLLALSAMIHDIGKLRPEINELIVSRQQFDPTDRSVWDIIERHPTVSGEVVLATRLDIGDKLAIADSVYKHHERPNGDGYYGFSARRIPPEAIVIGAADSVVAMLEKRPYKLPLSMDQVMLRLEKSKGQFSGHVLEAVKRMHDMSGGEVLLHKN